MSGIVAWQIKLFMWFLILLSHGLCMLIELKFAVRVSSKHKIELPFRIGTVYFQCNGILL